MYLICQADKSTSLKYQVTLWFGAHVCHHPDKLGGHRHCGSGDIFLICNMISEEHVTKGLCDFMDRSPLVSHHRAKINGHTHRGTRNF